MDTNDDLLIIFKFSHIKFLNFYCFYYFYNFYIDIRNIYSFIKYEIIIKIIIYYLYFLLRKT